MGNRYQAAAIILFLLLTACNVHVGEGEYEGVAIHVNDGSNARHLTEDGYNLGLKWQCVEFVKRYYYEKLDHTMPNSYGHAKDFFDYSVEDGGYNKERDLYQYYNVKGNIPKKGDILVFKATKNNPYGHVAIVHKASIFRVQFYQQNTRLYKNSLSLSHATIVGWLRKKT